MYYIIPWVISFHVKTDSQLRDIYEKTRDIPFEVGSMWSEEDIPFLVKKLGWKKAKDAMIVLTRVYSFLLKKNLITRTPVKQYLEHYGPYLLKVFDDIASEQKPVMNVPDWL